MVTFTCHDCIHAACIRSGDPETHLYCASEREVNFALECVLVGALSPVSHRGLHQGCVPLTKTVTFMCHASLTVPESLKKTAIGCPYIGNDDFHMS